MAKRIISLTISVIMLVLMMASCGTSSNVPSGMKLASSSDVDYYLYVPEEWKVDKSTLYTSAYYSSGDATSISATAFAMNVTDQTVDEWWEGFLEQLNVIYSDLSEVTKEEATLDTISAVKYSFSAKLNEQEYNFIIIAGIKGYYVYYLTYTSVPEYYENHLEELDQVVSEFRFK